MMNLKLTICSWILFFIILSSDTYAAPEETYSGEIITGDDALSPFQICAKHLNTESLVSFPEGDELCANNIKCSTEDNSTQVTLPLIPENGVICGSFAFSGELPHLLVCYNEKCIPVENSQNEKLFIMTQF